MPYTYKKEGDKYVVYKKDGGKRVGSTAGNKESLKKYLAALHMHENNKPQMKYIKTFEQFVNESKENSEELNERERLKYVGTYRAKDGNTYKKWKDDENYISIQIGDTYVTIEGDGETKSQDEIMKEIQAAKDDIKANRFNPIRNMSNADFKKHMRGY
jgi:hypothetical protein